MYALTIIRYWLTVIPYDSEENSCLSERQKQPNTGSCLYNFGVDTETFLVALISDWSTCLQKVTVWLVRLGLRVDLNNQ